MKIVIQITLLAGLTFWIALTAARIEYLNAQSGYYLPRQDGGADGKWRMTRYGSPRDHLRDLVENVGLLQYLLAPTTFALGLFIASRPSTAALRIIGSFCSVVALTCLGLALYRGYYSSLGW